MNSMSGTKGTKENALSSRDVCEILSACAANKVSVLKFGDLYVRFGPSAEELATTAIVEAQEHAANSKTNSDKEISESDHERINREGLEVEELRTREQQLAELQITDPLAAEEMLMNEELEEDVDESGD